MPSLSRPFPVLQVAAPGDGQAGFAVGFTGGCGLFGCAVEEQQELTDVRVGAHVEYEPGGLVDTYSLLFQQICNHPISLGTCRPCLKHDKQDSNLS